MVWVDDGRQARKSRCEPAGVEMRGGAALGMHPYGVKGDSTHGQREGAEQHTRRHGRCEDMHVPKGNILILASEAARTRSEW